MLTPSTRRGSSAARPEASSRALSGTACLLALALAGSALATAPAAGAASASTSDSLAPGSDPDRRRRCQRRVRRRRPAGAGRLRQPRPPWAGTVATLRRAGGAPRGPAGEPGHRGLDATVPEGGERRGRRGAGRPAEPGPSGGRRCPAPAPGGTAARRRRRPGLAHPVERRGRGRGGREP
ncbi:hypothetical protein LV779_08425 [Streptomyces thinghirensis]|nr:hypothetical protein [Streptomyces thinghirensis]